MADSVHQTFPMFSVGILFLPEIKLLSTFKRTEHMIDAVQDFFFCILILYLFFWFLTTHIIVTNTHKLHLQETRYTYNVPIPKCNTINYNSAKNFIMLC